MHACMEDPMSRAEVAHTVCFPRYRTVRARGELLANVLLIET